MLLKIVTLLLRLVHRKSTYPKARNNAGRYIFEPTINYDGYVDGLDIYIIVDGKRHYIGDESYVDPDKPELKVSHTKAVKKVLIADHHIEMKSALKTKVVPDDDSTRWPKIWDSSGTVYSLQPLVFPAEPYYNERKLVPIECERMMITIILTSFVLM
jgi:hypothetical protein